MNITKSFAEFMQANSYGSLTGKTLFIGGAPLDVADAIWWIISGGGSSSSTNATGQRMKNYLINVFYRDTDQEQVYEKLQAFEQFINSGDCTQLAGYDTVEMEATTFPTDQDLDNEDRTVGMVQVTLTTYM